MELRTLDGTGNNQDRPELNAAGTDFIRLGPANFSDGVSAPVDGPNPRLISNVVVGEGDAAVANPEGFSGMMYAWGQFIDHDLDLSPSGGVASLDVAVPPGDPVIAAGSVIPLTRAKTDPASGTDPAHPAIAVNAITGWLDGSMVYGSDAATAAALREPDGHLRTSPDGYLPIVDGAYAAGDERAAENPSLTALQTLFVREHNYQVDKLHAAHPELPGDELYDQARAIVGAEIAHITYSEFLPHLLGPNAVAPYHGYDPGVDPRISVEFAGAAYRFGHSIVSAETSKLTEGGETDGQPQELRDAFFEPPATFAAGTGADGVLRHLASDASQALDARIVDDLRNFLDDPPAAMDLAATNIERGRDLGLGTLNETRAALGLAPHEEFSQITSDQATADALREAFGSVDKVDLWTGGLAEDHALGAFVGPTFAAIIGDQFERLRDGDRLWFENQGLDQATLDAVERTSLSDIILRNTDTAHLQPDVFVFAERHGGAASGAEAEHPEAPQLVVGSDGGDTLEGGPQADMLVAGTGDQTLTGAAGGDWFVFAGTGPTMATVTDFEPGSDKLVFEGGAASGSGSGGLDIEESADGAKVTFGMTTVQLQGVAPDAVSPLDFLVAPSGLHKSDFFLA
jgi:peroxidase